MGLQRKAGLANGARELTGAWDRSPPRQRVQMDRMTCVFDVPDLPMVFGLVGNGTSHAGLWGLRVDGTTPADHEDITSCRLL